MRAYRQLETCSAPDRDLGLVPACLPACPYGSIKSQWYLNPAWPFTWGLVACPDMKCKWGIEDVNREMPASQSDIVINSAIFVLRATGGKKKKTHMDAEHVMNPERPPLLHLHCKHTVGHTHTPTCSCVFIRSHGDRRTDKTNLYHANHFLHTVHMVHVYHH